MDVLEIKLSPRISAGVDDCPCFSTMIPIDCKITNFSLHLFDLLFGNNYNIDELTNATSKERITMIIIFADGTLVN